MDVHETSGADTPPQSNASKPDTADPALQSPELRGVIEDAGTTSADDTRAPLPATAAGRPAHNGSTDLPASASEVADLTPATSVEQAAGNLDAVPAPAVAEPQSTPVEHTATPVANALPDSALDLTAAPANPRDAIPTQATTPSIAAGGSEDHAADVADVEADVAAATGPEQLAVLARIEKRLDELVRLGDRNADHVGALHSENQRLRNGEIQTALNAHIRDVIRVYDDVVRLTGTGSPAEGDLRIVGDLLVGTLGRWGVELFEPALGDPFDTSVHSGVGRVSTAEQPSNTIASVRRCGFRSADGKTIRTADVEVFWLAAPATPATESPPAAITPASTQEVES